MRDSVRMQRFRDFITFHRNRNGLVLNKPIREKHLVSVLCSLMTIVCIVVALSMQQWAVSGSSLCDCSFGLTKVHCTTGISTAKTCSDVPSKSIESYKGKKWVGQDQEDKTVSPRVTVHV